MSESLEQKDATDNNSEWEESLDTNTHAMISHNDTMISDSEVIRRFLVTKDKTLMAMGSTTKYLEVLYDGSVRIRDVKKSTYSDPIHQPWEVFKKDILDSSHSLKNKKKAQKKDKLEHDKLKIYMDGKTKKRYFKFSTLQEKQEFFKLIEDLRKKKDRSIQKKKYSTEPFIFAPYEVVGFFIRNAIVYRNGSTIKYRDKLIAITNYRIVVVDPDLVNPSVSPASDVKNNNESEDNNYNNKYDQAATYKQNTLRRGDHIIPALSIPHHSVYFYDISDNHQVIKLETKDYTTITIDLSNIVNSTLRTQSLFMMKRYLLPSDEKDIFAFAGYFSVTRTKTPSHSEADISKLSGFPELNRVKISHKNGHKNGHKNAITLHDKDNLMSLYMQLRDSRYHTSHVDDLIMSEYRRLGWTGNSNTTNPEDDCPYRVTLLNEKYELCTTYPKYLLVPSAAKDNLIKRAAQHRSRNRLPVITWCNSYRISLARSSQPQAGASHKRNEYDERLLLLLNSMNSYSETFVICDCRPRVNAIANQYMKGKGFESGDNYEKAHIIFFDIQNIHEMRKSVNALKKCCENQFDKNWLKNLHETQWFQHITKIIQCSRRCANMIDKDKYSVLVHCSDGWDRTAQVCCLAQLLLDPYYRTFSGFLLLIQKEWLWFGHKFAERNSNYNGASSKHDKKRERSPIFLQFLDCCFQVMMQFPWAFDFTQDLLLEFSLHCNSGRFGDFFCNCAREREEQQLWLRTPSLFKYLHALWKLGRFRNADYIPTKTVLRPRYAVRDMILWDEVYCRFTMHDKDRHSSSVFMPKTNKNNRSMDFNIINGGVTGGAPPPRNQSKSVASVVGKNRYHPRSPRISSVMFGAAATKTSPVISGIAAYSSDDNLKRTKPPPPPPKKTQQQHLASSATSPINLQESGDLEQHNNSGGSGNNLIAPISVIDHHDDGVDGDRLLNDSDSDSGSIPEKVKRITLLQKKVAQLESILKEYRNKEKDEEEAYDVITPSMTAVEDYPLSNDINQNQQKGNIV